MDTPARRLRSTAARSPDAATSPAKTPRASSSRSAAPGPSTPRAHARAPGRYALRNNGRSDVFGDITTPVRNGQPRSRSPEPAFSRKNKDDKSASREYGDRFIPVREEEDTAAVFNLAVHYDSANMPGSKSGARRIAHLGQATDAEARREEVNATFTHILRTELLPSPSSGSRTQSPAAGSPARNPREAAARRLLPTPRFDSRGATPASASALPLDPSADATPRHHHPPPELAGSGDLEDGERELSPASILPPMALHAPSSPAAGHVRAMGSGPSGPQHRAHQSQVALTSVHNRTVITPPSSVERAARKSAFSPPPPGPNDSPATPTRRRLLNFQSPTAVRMASFSGSYAVGAGDLDDMGHEAYRLSPVGKDSQKVLLSPRKHLRHIARTPFKVLDAPELADDFYLNLVSWSATNVLAVGLGPCVYLWSAQTSRVTKLCDLIPEGESREGHSDSMTSVEWTNKGSTLALGSNRGSVEIWDAEYCKKIRTMSGHTGRVGCLAWNGPVLTSGSRDRTILHRDTRVPDQYIRKLQGFHKQEVCGLRWNGDTGQLASGGNDNKLFVWNAMDERPTWRFAEHRAAVKAIAWNPHQRGVLASGGGTADKTIRFWNSMTGALISEWDTGSQVCNLMWSRTSNELVSTHGYSGGPVSNQIHIWRYPSMTQVATLTGHTTRVLYLAMSPEGQTIVTGAGDETLRFWNAFERPRGDILQSIMHGGSGGGPSGSRSPGGRSGGGGGGGGSSGATATAGLPGMNPFLRIR